jgi:hypothetical protein
MAIIKLPNRLAGALLARFGLSLAKANEQVLYSQHLILIEQMEACFKELICHDLPHCEQRDKLMARLLGTSVAEALYILEFLHKSLNLEGDICEFGVAQGATSALLANEIRGTPKNLWLFDSFRGLPKPTEKDLLIDDIFNLGSIDMYEGTMSCQVNEVITRLRDISFPLSRCRIVAGFVEETLKCEALPDKVSFAYVDFDFYSPTLMVLNFLDKSLSAGGFAVVDDYGFFSSGVKIAVDEFVADYSERYEIIFPRKFAGHFCILHKKVE